jgi:hypothetical protein
MAGEIHIGCSGWVYPSWRAVLYPPGLAQTHCEKLPPGRHAFEFRHPS